MGQPVKLSDDLVSDARTVASVAERSIAGQIELWASIGRAVEPMLRTESVLELNQKARATPLAECLARPGTSRGAKRLQRVLSKRPFPHYEAVADRSGWFVRTDRDGTRTTGRFVKRKFVGKAE